MAKIVHSDGKVTYYYYKKKNGRHKKSGRKKQKKVLSVKKYKIWEYKIVETIDKIQTKYIGKYHTVEEALNAKETILKNNESVEFPVKYINNGHKSNKINEYDSEYLILQRINNGDNVSQFRNEYGRYIDVKTSSEKWLIYDKFKSKKEETFWVYRYNPKNDRKTYRWIVENFIDETMNETFIRIKLYNNKVLFKYDSLEFNMVICKNISDAIRMYNLIENQYKKYKQIIMCGIIQGHTQNTSNIVEEIKEKTGWDYKKIYRTTT